MSQFLEGSKASQKIILKKTDEQILKVIGKKDLIFFEIKGKFMPVV
ncbi:MAG: hypothetical protein PHD83_02035 [Caldisericia bacterium]|nr:hypothetical protein [Caldisericia bacterium]